jgi:hypothetical protein
MTEEKIPYNIDSADDEPERARVAALQLTAGLVHLQVKKIRVQAVMASGGGASHLAITRVADLVDQLKGCA